MASNWDRTMIKRNVYSITKTKGRLYYIKDVGTLEQKSSSWAKCLIGMGLSAILALYTWPVPRTGFQSKAHCRVAKPWCSYVLLPQKTELGVFMTRNFIKSLVKSWWELFVNKSSNKCRFKRAGPLIMNWPWIEAEWLTRRKPAKNSSPMNPTNGNRALGQHGCLVANTINGESHTSFHSLLSEWMSHCNGTSGFMNELLYHVHDLKLSIIN